MVFEATRDDCSETLVCGAGGFIGGHLVAKLRRGGKRRIRAVDLKPLDDWYQRFDDVENLSLDLQDFAACKEVVHGMHQVFNLAADMGGIGFIENNKALHDFSADQHPLADGGA